jgi:hypothetical protein
MQHDNKRRVPPGKANLPDDLCVRKKILRPRPEKTMVYQGMGAKRILPKRRMHQIFVQGPLEETRIDKAKEESCRLADKNGHRTPFNAAIVLEPYPPRLRLRMRFHGNSAGTNVWESLRRKRFITVFNRLGWFFRRDPKLSAIYAFFSDSSIKSANIAVPILPGLRRGSFMVA